MIAALLEVALGPVCVDEPDLPPVRAKGKSLIHLLYMYICIYVYEFISVHVASCQALPHIFQTVSIWILSCEAL